MTNANSIALKYRLKELERNVENRRKEIEKVLTK